MTEFSLAQVDLEEVLHRLALHARHLITAARCRGVDDLVLPGGDSLQDLVSAILLKFLDPRDSSVVWRERLGPPTTAGLVIFLRVVLERDFLNLVRSKRYRAAVYPDRDELPAESREFEGDWFDSLPTHLADPEQETMRQEETSRLLEQFREEPELEPILRMQLESDGYNAFSNLELARMLAVSVTEIENRKRRLKRRLKNLAASRQTEGANHG